MIYDVRHRTVYRYESAVTYARCVLRLTPSDLPRQTVLEWSTQIEPQPAERALSIGAFGEQVLRIVVDTPHEELVIESRGRVDVRAAAPGDPRQSDPWELVRDQSLRAGGLDLEAPALFLYPTRRTPTIAAVTEYARASFPAGRPVVEAAADLMRRMKADFTYDTEATDVETPAAEAFRLRRGVCQDFAHLMISGLHGLGLPARYVSGYLRTVPPPGKPRLEGADATHAWVEVWCGPQRGWIGVDPTNAAFAETDYIVLAMGRDYSDAAPIDGVLLGPGHQTIEVEVDVIPEEPEATPRTAKAV